MQSLSSSLFLSLYDLLRNFVDSDILIKKIVLFFQFSIMFMEY